MEPSLPPTGPAACGKLDAQKRDGPRAAKPAPNHGRESREARSSTPRSSTGGALPEASLALARSFVQLARRSRDADRFISPPRIAHALVAKGELPVAREQDALLPYEVVTM